MLHSHPTFVFKILIPLLPILCLFPLHPHHRPLLLAVLLRLLPPLPLILLGFFNGILEVFELGALNSFTFFLPILLTLSVSRNPILTHLPLSGFLDSLLCVLIAPTPGLAFSLVMPRSLTLTYLPFYIAPLAVAPTLTSPLLSPLLLFLALGRCFRTWVLTTYQSFYLSLFLRSFAPTSTPLQFSESSMG